ncbi:MAG: hypothetical protein ACI9TY_001576 [Alphaproteobacteria bacterium]|jgi:hypothetical protein
MSSQNKKSHTEKEASIQKLVKPENRFLMLIYAVIFVAIPPTLAIIFGR